ncbi:MAG: tetratricopeptide repeat protein [bacterium]
MNERENGSGMDQISAHLDRGWALIAEKSFRKAAFSARQVLELDPECADAYALIGLAALGEHDAEEALEAFDSARELDPDWLAPIIYSAEALALDPERTAEAIHRVEEAYDLVEPGTPEYVDAVLLHVDLLCSAGDEPGARRKLALIDAAHLTQPDQQLQAGKLAVQLDDLELAEAALAPLADRPDTPAEALYNLAQLAERKGDLERMLKLSLAVREADLAQAVAAELPDPDSLTKLCREQIAALDPQLREVVADAQLVVLEVPAMELIADGMDPWSPVLLTGPPPDPKGEPGGPTRACHIFLYRINLRFESPHAEDQEAQLRGYLVEAIERFRELS